MNPYQNPGAGGRGNSHGNGTRNMQVSEQGFSHRQGQSMLNRPYSGLHGGFQYDDMPTRQHQPQSYPTYPVIVHQESPREGQSNLLPTVLPPTQNSLLPAPPASGGGGKGFSLANLLKYANPTEIKGFVDRMGGLDGILSTVTKVQKVVGSVSQMAPLMKVFMGSFGKKSQPAPSDNGGSGLSRPRPRKRRTTNSGSGRKSSVKRQSRPRRRR